MIQSWIFLVQVQLNTPKPLDIFLKILVTSLTVTDPQVGPPLSQPIVLLGNSISAALEPGNLVCCQVFTSLVRSV